MTSVKICGIQNVEDALAIAEAGADAIGIVFVPSAGRCITVDNADEIITGFRKEWGNRPAPKMVGMFGDQPLQEVNDCVARLNLDGVQLCGDEGMAYCEQMTAPVYKVIPVRTDVPWSVVVPKLMVMLQRHTMAGHHPVIDTQVPGQYGGTGQTFGWSHIRDLWHSFPFSLAGGLNPDNIAQAIAVAHPWGVDSSSGTEAEGRKDAEKIRAFVEAVREADRALAPKGLARLFRRSKR